MIASYLIHPMIVHFPIVLFLTVPVFDAFILLRGGDLAAKEKLANVGLAIMIAGVTAGLVAIMFGYIAADHAAALGFPTAPVEEHEGFATTTVSVFAVLSVIRLHFRTRGISLAGTRGWLFVGATAIGALLVIATAYFGGHLVYDLGVNVAPVKP